MWQKYRSFIRGVSVNWVGRLGVVLVTATVISFFVFEIAHTAGLIRNAYFGLVTYLAFPLLFVAGLILIPVGWHKYKKETGRSTSELLSEQFAKEELAPKQTGAGVFRAVTVLTVLNIVIVGGASLRMLHFMDQEEFCGTACHDVMNPEWVTYQQSPHARVPCVECHVGEGLDALVGAKLNGVRQMYLAALNKYNRPVPTPVHTLRPARETCEHCHWPDKFYGRRQITHVNYQMDEPSTPLYTTLSLKIDAARPAGGAGAHWHVGAQNEVRYTSVDDKRRKMLEVRVRQEDGSFKVYRNQRAHELESTEEERVMDCVDCHNRATHIYKDPGRAVDEAIRAGTIDRSLPFIKREALGAIIGSYAGEREAMNGIENRLNGYYSRHYPDAFETRNRAIQQAVVVLQDIYSTYRHHHMKIDWGTYPSHIGHDRDLGCVRCHNPDMKAASGETIRHDCTMCHSILAMDSPSPMEYLRATQQDTPDELMQNYLRDEYLKELP